MKRIALATLLGASLLTGCASVPVADTQATNAAKEFKAPSQDKAGIYVYRKDSVVGAALKKDIWIDDLCIGESAKGVFFYHEVDGNTEHKISTESEFSPNDLLLKTESGELYFVEQYIKMGAFVGGAGLEHQPKDVGMKEISALEMAVKGKCSS